MGRWFWFGFTGLLVAAMLTGGYVMFTPKIGHATPAAIVAVLPASLKVQDAPDPAGEERYRRLVAILKGIDREPISYTQRPKTGTSLPQNEAVLAKVEALLREGNLRVPKRRASDLLSEGVPLKDAANLMRLAVQTAQERGDRNACERWAILGLRYSQALNDSQGVVIDGLVHVAIEAIVNRAIYLAEINGGFDEAGRTKILALLTPANGASPEMAAAVRRDFQAYWMPLLLDPPKHVKELAAYQPGDYSIGYDEPIPEPKLAGTFDPLDTARLGGKLYQAMMDDLLRPLPQATKKVQKIAAEAERGLPPPAFSGPEGMWYRVRMNLGRNTLGRQGISSGSLLMIGTATARNDTTRNLVRATILLRMGQRPALPDPYGKGDLRFDTKRKIVWSVGDKGVDDGGVIGRGWDPGAADYGCPYGDRSWSPRKPAVPGGRPAGFGPGPGAPSGPPPGLPPGPDRSD